MALVVYLAVLGVACFARTTAAECISCRGGNCRKVSGFLSRPHLPVGYNLIARVPAGACNLTVKETRASSNYLAIRTSNGYVINGNWAIVPSGRYMGAGTGFLYTRHDSGSLAEGLLGPAEAMRSMGEVVFAPGPITENVDVMIIYQRPNPGVRYEYWYPTEDPSTSRAFYSPSLPPPAPPPHSLQQPSQGFPAPSHVGAPPAPHALLPGAHSQALPVSAHGRPTPPQVPLPHHQQQPQSSTAFLQNAQPAFVAHPPQVDSRLQGHGASATGGAGADLGTAGGVFRGGMPMEGYLPQEDRGVMPSFLPPGNTGSGREGRPVDPMAPDWRIWKFTPCSRTCGGGDQATVYTCTGLGNQQLPEHLCTKPRPAIQRVRCNTRPCPPGWQLGEWSPCSATCGRSLMTRSWVCMQVVSPTVTRTVPPNLCPAQPRAPSSLTTMACNLPPCTRWQVSEWGKCSVECGTGVSRRQVTCEADGHRVKRGQCNAQEEPPAKRLCHARGCAHHTWFYTDWSDQCIGGCEEGVQVRRVWCLPGVNTVEGECDPAERPSDTRPCPNSDACGATWFTGPWTPCSVECGNGTKTREVVCVMFLRGTFRATLEVECAEELRPSRSETCNPEACTTHWYYTDWSQCSRRCGGGSKSRAVQCLDEDQQPSTACPIEDKPITSRACNTHACPPPSDRGCVDRFRNCNLVQQARLCHYSYYRSVCCASCFNE